MSRVRRVRHHPWVSPLAVAAGLAQRDGALCLLSDPARAGARSFVAVAPDRLGIDVLSSDLFAPLDGPDMDAGVVGLVAYDAGARVATGGRSPVWPDLILARYPDLLVFDHDAATVAIVGWGQDAEDADRACDRAEAWLDPATQSVVPPPPATAIVAETSDQAYCDAVAETVSRIAAGELFQANIARSWTGDLSPTADPFDVFLRLADAGSAPFGAFWRIGDRAVVSNSPELFVALNRATGDVETRPIKGTRPRLADPVADAAQAHQLLASAKDRAENLMIVDLMRNDLARVCVAGSVRVDRLFDLERHPTVHHLVSTVTGRLRPGLGVSDLMRATFPPGSITGAPKHQAMKVIAELEPPRGAWCGSLFVLDERGDLASSVLIRTATFERVRGRWRYRALAGAGIVADSVPELELAETEVKISALRHALCGKASG